MTAPAWMLQKAAAHEARVAEVQRQRREQMPTVAGMVDLVRRYFKNAQVVHADEGNGRTFGKPIQVEETLSSDQMMAMLRDNDTRQKRNKSGGVERKATSRPQEVRPR